MNLLKSVEALLYEVVSWLVFYPITLWRSIRHPILMIGYAHQELAKPPEQQFIDAISPPIFLFLTIVLANVIDLGFSTAHTSIGGIFSDTRNLLIFRAVAFSLFPLLLAVQSVYQQALPLTRQTLRPAFYGHCFLAAPFVLAIDLSLTVGQHGGTLTTIIGTVIIVAGLAWYLGALTGWFSIYRRTSRKRAFARALLFVALGCCALWCLLVIAALSVAVSNGAAGTPA